jgi:hypothetical protein
VECTCPETNREYLTSLLGIFETDDAWSLMTDFRMLHLPSPSVCNNILPRYGNMDLRIICKVYARYESCKECYYTNSHRCQSNSRVNVATIVHVALASLCSYCCKHCPHQSLLKTSTIFPKMSHYKYQGTKHPVLSL